MKQFLEQMAELFEVDSILKENEITEMEAWDSLTSLSVIALVDDEYGIVLTANEIIESHTFENLFNLIQSKKGV